MKKLLIALNSILFLCVAVLMAGNFHAATSKKTPAAANRRKTTPQARKNVKRTEKNDNENKSVELPEINKAVDAIITADIFNTARSPFANVRISRNDLVLVGVFQTANVSGAIIKQNSRDRQFNPYMMQAMRMSGSQRGRGFSPWNAANGRNQQPQRQYVRIGETMNNGYTLVEVSRQRAVLVRGNDKLELELQDPSKNRTAAPRQRRMNGQQQFQQAQLFLQAEMIRALRGSGGNRNAAPPANRGRR